MNNQRLLFGAAWLASLVLVYFIASGGETAKSPANGADVAGGANPASATEASRNPDSASRDRTMRRSMDQMEEVGKKEKANVTQLIAQARLQIGGMGMMNMRGMLRAMAPLADLDDAQLQEALGEVERTVKEPQQRMMLYSLLLTQWAETDGKAALAYADEKMGPQSGLNMGVRGSILGTWAGRDPDAAWAWFQTQGKDNASDPMGGGFTTTMLFSGLAANNLDSALQRLGTLDDASRAMALNGIANSASDTAGRTRLLERAAALPAEQRAQIYQSIASRSAMMDPEGTVKWIHSLPAEEQKPVRDSASSTLMMVNPALGAEVTMEGLEEKDKPQAYARVAGQWAYRDPRAAGEWLMKQPQGPELDNARSSYANAVAQKDPTAAMDWAKSVQEDNMRTNSVQQVYNQWRAKDAAAADAALDASGLSEEKIKQFRAAPVPKPPSRGFGGFGF